MPEVHLPGVAIQEVPAGANIAYMLAKTIREYGLGGHQRKKTEKQKTPPQYSSGIANIS
jgi:hypothetical protein